MGTRLYGPDPLPLEPAFPNNMARTRVEVTGETSLDAARRLLRENSNSVGVLNFASARNPGGGFLNGANAQEESLCRASALYACLLAAPGYYEHHRIARTPLYSDRVIFSPFVPVFRNDLGDLLDEPYLVSFLTSPAPNAGVIARDKPTAVKEIAPALESRCAQVLAVAAREGVQRLVLGAWGCGVFQNTPTQVAHAFNTHLQAGGRFAERFTHVVLAVFDPRPGAPNRLAFEREFGTATYRETPQ
jgi:uncharacterized protein (TIGR02452 family)